MNAAPINTTQPNATKPSATKPNGLQVNLRRTIAAKRRRPFTLDVEFSVACGVTVVFGPSGSGKTTILQCLAGLLRPDQGNISISGELLFDSARKINVPAQQRRAGYLFQELALFPHIAAAENVGFGIRVNGTEKKRIVHDILERFRIAHVAGHRPDELSGGERQRVALARALVIQPRFLLLDEPFSALDDALKQEIIADLKRWLEQARIPVLLVTHDRDEAVALGDRMLLLREGRIVDEQDLAKNSYH
ncbi:MAG TPA: ATP-binding cassette domain-containing protein [Verrucomicrobiae bacterium]|jgi:molybdate transport system ATP-binding protein|nr:ATP-binding cassette domain-containing protein [Verrucomicrobiae bacterium]